MNYLSGRTNVYQSFGSVTFYLADPDPLGTDLSFNSVIFRKSNRKLIDNASDKRIYNRADRLVLSYFVV